MNGPSSVIARSWRPHDAGSDDGSCVDRNVQRPQGVDPDRDQCRVGNGGLASVNGCRTPAWEDELANIEALPDRWDSGAGRGLLVEFDDYLTKQDRLCDLH